MEKTEVAKKVADKLFATEHAVDEAMVRASQLLETMVEARRELRLSAVVGEVATSRAAESIAALSEARRAVMAAHGALQNLQRKMEIEDAVVGTIDKYPEENVARGEAQVARPGLRVAASQ